MKNGQNQTHIRRKRSVVFSEVGHISMKSTLFAFQNLLCFASWPVVHEKQHSCTCPTLVLHGGRAGKWQLWMMQQAWSPSKYRLFHTSKKPWVALGVQVQQARTKTQRPRDVLTRDCAQCYRGQEAVPRGHLWGSP